MRKRSYDAAQRSRASPGIRAGKGGVNPGVTAEFRSGFNAAVNVAFNQGLSTLFSSAWSAWSNVASNRAVSATLSARSSSALNGTFSSVLDRRLMAGLSRAFTCAFSCSFTEAFSGVFSAATTGEFRRTLNWALLVLLPARAAVCSYAQGPICSGRDLPDHNSAVGGAARRPPGELQLPMQLKIDWTIQ